jgi:hypothetical protein
LENKADIYEGDKLLGQIDLRYGRSGILFNKSINKGCYYVIDLGIKDDLIKNRLFSIKVNKMGLDKLKFIQKTKIISFIFQALSP